MTQLNNVSFNNLVNTQKLNQTNNVNKQVLFSSGDKDSVELSTKNDSIKDKSKRSTGNKAGTALASFFLPGLGQLIKGENNKAAVMFGGTIVAGLAAYAICPVLVPTIGFGMGLYSAYDAYKN
jgi:hypothetical protein